MKDFAGRLGICHLSSEPAGLKRQDLGVWVLLFLGFFTFMAWLVKKEYWKDVH